METTSKLPLSSRIFILGLGLTQGVAVYLFVEFDKYFSPGLKIGYITVTIAVPLFAMLLVGSLRSRLFWALLGGYTLLVSGMGGYAGYQCSDGENYLCTENIFPNYILPQTVMGFVVLFFAQVWLRTGRREFSYSDLYDASWHNTITFVLAWVFTGLFWGVLWLCAALFSAIGVKFFSDLFTSVEFGLPASGLMFASGIVLFREMHGVVEVIKRILRILMRWLLVAIAVLVLTFLIGLSVTGLQPLWNTRSAALLLLWVIAVTLFTLCAVYQDGEEDVPYPGALGWVIKAAIIALPVYAVIAVYALSLRVLQYGWSTERLLAAIVLVLLSGFAVAYVYALLRYQQKWVVFFVKTNRLMAVVVAVASGLLATPLFDTYRISAHSQIARFTPERSQEAPYLNYLRFDLGRAGYQALQQLREREDVKLDTQVLADIDAAIASQNRWYAPPRHTTATAATLREQIAVFPATAVVPGELFDAMLEREGSNYNCSVQDNRCYLLVVDLTGDARPEYVLLYGGYYVNGDIYVANGDHYKFGARISDGVYLQHKELKELLQAGDYAPVTSGWKQLRLGDNMVNVNVVNK